MLLLNDTSINPLIYPNNESLLRPDLYSFKDADTWKVTLRFTGDEDIFRLQVLTKALHEWNAREEEPHFIDLHILYMPYSRADRSENDSIFTLKYVADIINSLEFDRVIVYEPHSDVTSELLHCTVRWTTVPIAKRAILSVATQAGLSPADYSTYLVLPDKGAAERYIGSDILFQTFPTLVAEKTRDFKTGKITDLTFPNPVEIENGGRAFIVDDLCSKGGTFIWTANLLREMGFTEVHLVVTHFEEVGWNHTLFDAMDGIYASDSMPSPNVSIKFHRYKLNELFEDDII